MINSSPVIPLIQQSLQQGPPAISLQGPVTVITVLMIYEDEEG